jgi:hypothetical protein
MLCYCCPITHLLSAGFLFEKVFLFAEEIGRTTEITER